jgi:hypothetical protein
LGLSTVRYDNVFSCTNKMGLRPKKLFNLFSDAVDNEGECMPSQILAPSSPLSCADDSVRDGSGVGGGAASMTILHGVRSPRHAGAVQPHQQVRRDVATSPKPASPTTPPRCTAIPRCPVTPCGLPEVRPVLHGGPGCMPPTPISVTSITQKKVLNSPFFFLLPI